MATFASPAAPAPVPVDTRVVIDWGAGAPARSLTILGAPEQEVQLSFRATLAEAEATWEASGGPTDAAGFAEVEIGRGWQERDDGDMFGPVDERPLERLRISAEHHLLDTALVFDHVEH